MSTPAIDGPVIMTVSGRYVEPLHLDDRDVVLQDVAHSLSNQCRFTGHTRVFYSVAEHCVRVARLLESLGYPLEVVQQGLLHDGSEAYLVDIPRPLKVEPRFGRAYRPAEARAQKAVYAAFGLPTREHEAVKWADRIMLSTERRDLMPPSPEPWLILEGYAPLEKPIRPWTPRRAHREFVATYHRLFT